MFPIYPYSVAVTVGDWKLRNSGHRETGSLSILKKLSSLGLIHPEKYDRRAGKKNQILINPLIRKICRFIGLSEGKLAIDMSVSGPNAAVAWKDDNSKDTHKIPQ